MSLARKVVLNSAAQAGMTLFSAVSGLLSVAIAARYLAIEDYGSILVAMALVAVLSVLADFGLTTMGARVLAREEHDEARIVGGLLWAGAAFAVVAAALILLAGQLLYRGAEHELTRDAILVFLAPWLLTPWRAAAQAKAVATQRVYLTALSETTARAVSLGLVVVVAAAELGPIAMAGAYASAMALEAVLTISLVRPPVLAGLRAGAARSRELVTAALPLGGVMAINGLYARIDALLLSVLAGQAEVAIYAVAFRVFTMVSNLPAYVMVTLLPEIARLEPGDPRFRQLVQKAFSSMWLVATPFVAFALCGPELMTLLGGERYAQGGLVLALIVLGVVLAVLNGVFGHTLVALGRQAVLLKVAAGVLVANVVLNVALIPPFGAEGAAAALLATEALSLAATMVVFARIAPLPAPHMPVRTTLAIGVTALAVSVKFAIDDAALALLVAGALGAVAYVGSLIALRAIPSFLVAAAPLGRFRRLTRAT